QQVPGTEGRFARRTHAARPGRRPDPARPREPLPHVQAPPARHQEITARTFKDYYATCERIVGVFGRSRLVSDLTAVDFEKLRGELAKTMGVVSLGNEIQRVRVVFKYADDTGLIDRVPRYGPGFKKPSRKSLRLARVARGKRMFEAEELRQLLDRAG